MTNQTAPAKLNLGLRVLRRRKDGYHDILTLFLAVDWSDRLAVEVSTGADSMTCTDPAIPIDETNLCLRAVTALRSWAKERSSEPSFTALSDSDRAAGSRGPETDSTPYRLTRRAPDLAPLHIHLEKQIPAGAGLGGGSSDAAATLRAAARIWGLDVPEEDLLKIAAGLGADVPFFLDPQPSLATGIGDDLRPLTARPGLPIEHIVIAVPDIHVSTAEAYAGVIPRPPDDATGERGIPESDGKRLAAAYVSTDPAVWRRDLVNDFEASVFERYPAIAELKQALINAGALYASMSGSGSAVFGIFQTSDQAESAEERLKRIENTSAEGPGVRVFRGRGLRRGGLR